MKSKLLTIILSLILLLAFATPALAQDGPDEGDRVIFGRDFTLQPEEKIDGNVVVFGGSVTIPAGSEIDGDLVVFGGNARIDGTVTGNIGMLGGKATLGETAVIEGDVSLVGGEVERMEGAVVEGRVEGVISGGEKYAEEYAEEAAEAAEEDAEKAAEAAEEAAEEGLTSPVAPIAPIRPTPPTPPIRPVYSESHPFNWLDEVFDFFKYVIGTVVFFIALAAVSWLVATFMPEQMKVTGDTLVESAAASFGVGLLTTLLSLVIGGILLITICLAFIPPLAFILLVIAALFGWIVTGQLIGERLMIASGRPYPNFVASTVLGVMVLTFVVKMPVIELVPCLGWMLNVVGVLLGIIVANAGLGAVILTRFGTQPYPSASSAFGYSPSPGPTPATKEDRPRPRSVSPLDRSEAELRAKIRAALAEADAAKSPGLEERPAGEEADDEPKPTEPEPTETGEPGLPELPEDESPPPTGDEPKK